MDAVSKVSPFAYGYLTNAHPVSFEKNVLVIGYDPEFEDQIGLVDHSRNHTLISTKLSEMGHANSMVKFIVADAPAGWVRKPATPPPAAVPSSPRPAAAPAAQKTTDASPAPATPAAATEKKTAAVPFSKEDFKNDPLIQKALEVFKGTIIEVRA